MKKVVIFDLNGYQMSTNADDHKMLYARGYELGREFLLSNSLRAVPLA